jgi:hypothetical protein
LPGSDRRPHSVCSSLRVRINIRKVIPRGVVICRGHRKRVGVVLWITECIFTNEHAVQTMKNGMTTYIERVLGSGPKEYVLSYESLRAWLKDGSRIWMNLLRTLDKVILAQNPTGYGREEFALCPTTTATLTSPMPRLPTLKLKAFHPHPSSKLSFFWSEFPPATSTTVRRQ